METVSIALTQACICIWMETERALYFTSVLVNFHNGKQKCYNPTTHNLTILQPHNLHLGAFRLPLPPAIRGASPSDASCCRDPAAPQVLLPSLAQQVTDWRFPMSLLPPLFGIWRPADAMACPGPTCPCPPKYATKAGLRGDPRYSFICAPQLRSLATRESPPSLPHGSIQPQILFLSLNLPISFWGQGTRYQSKHDDMYSFFLRKH